MVKFEPAYVVIDIETSGLSPVKGHRIIEIGAIAIENDRLTRQFHSLVDPGMKMPDDAVKIHGITDDMLIGQPNPCDTYPLFKKFIGNAVLVAHNAAFDLIFLRSEMSRLGISLNNRSICTLKLSRRLFPALRSYRLETVARHVLSNSKKIVARHRALDDAKLTAMMWLEMIKNG